MTKKEIAKLIAAHHGIDQVIAKRAVQEVLDQIVEALLKNGRMELRNFGVFELKRRAPRVARNPRTNEQVSVPAKTVVVFQPGKKLAEMVSRLEQIPGSSIGSESGSAVRQQVTGSNPGNGGFGS